MLYITWALCYICWLQLSSLDSWKECFQYSSRPQQQTEFGQPESKQQWKWFLKMTYCKLRIICVRNLQFGTFILLVLVTLVMLSTVWKQTLLKKSIWQVLNKVKKVINIFQGNIDSEYNRISSNNPSVLFFGTSIWICLVSDLPCF